jgi:hypothetical protein
MRILIIFSVLLGYGIAAAEESRLLGAATCASSNCHGSVNPRSATNVLQNEYVTWQKEDAHSRAYQTLLSEDSKTIARHLGIPEAHRSKECLSCHTTATSGYSHGEKFRVEDGVSCEACHGAGENWLKSHVEKGATHWDNVTNGLTDLSTAGKQATLCLSCHYGDSERAVTHRLIGAGHPRLTFELDTFTAIMPRHWLIDEDYRKRKGDYRPFEGWLTSQLLRSKRILSHLKSPTIREFFPEFSLYNCSSCHHSLKSEEWKTRDYQGRPGEVALNLGSLRMVAVVLEPVDSGRAKRLLTALRELERAANKGGIAEAASLVEKLLDGLEFSSPQVFPSQLKALINFGANADYLYYEDAEQIAMGISAALADDIGDKGLIEPKLKLVYETLKDSRDFTFADFKKRMGELKERAK